MSEPESRVDSVKPSDADRETVLKEVPDQQSDTCMQPGELIAGRYEIISVIGCGGMGAVYKAKQPYLDKLYAIKLMMDEQAGGTAWRRFQTEAKAMCELRHQNLISVYDMDFHKDRPFMVMDYVEGFALSDYLKRYGPMSVRDTIAVGIQIADGMSYTHHMGILHRDLKPSNIMLSGMPGSLKVKILDFGIAKMAPKISEQDDHGLTRTGEIFGSPLYMSPEQASGKPTDTRSDIYSLGALLFECLTGEPPFRGDSILETMYLRTQESAPLVRERLKSGSVPCALESLIAKALQTDPDNRIQTMDDFWHTLGELSKSGGPLVGSGVRSFRAPTQFNISLGVYMFALTALIGLVAFVLISTLNQRSPVIPRQAESTDNPITDTLQSISPRQEALSELHLNSNSTDARLDYDYLKMALGEDDMDALVSLPLRRIHFDHQRGINDACLKRLSSVKTLCTLSLKGTGITNSGLSYLQALPQLTTLDIPECSKVDRNVGSVLATLSNLENITLSRDNIDNRCLKEIKGLPLLRAYLKGTKITDAGLLQLSHKDLIALSVGENDRMNDQTAELIGQTFPHLTSLFFADTPISDAGVAKLEKLPLTELRLELDGRLTNKACRSIGKIKSLRVLLLNGCHISDAGMKELAELPNLRVLGLNDTDITDKGLKILAESRSLRDVTMRGTAVTDKGRRYLQAEGKLSHLRQP